MRSRWSQAAPMTRRRIRQRRSPAGRIRCACMALPEETAAEAVPASAAEAAVVAVAPVEAAA